MAGADWAFCLASRRQVNSCCDVRRDAARHHRPVSPRAVTLGDARRLLRARPASPWTGADRDEIRVIAETAKNESATSAQDRKRPLRVIHVIPAIPACPVHPKSGHSANARVYEYTL